MPNKSVTYCIVRALADYLKAKVPSLRAVYDDFPAPTQALTYPCASIFTGKPSFRSSMPYTFHMEADPESGKAKVRNVVGVYEFRLQVDLWVGNKFERHALQEAVFQALNPYPGQGLNLQLQDYFAAWAHYSMTDFDFVNSSEGSQRDEWRVRFDVIADVKAQVEGLDYTIQKIENHLEIPDEIPNPPLEEEEII